MTEHTYDEVLKHFVDSTGIKSPRDLFYSTKATTFIYDGIPISTGRFVTIHYEAYSLIRGGLDAGIEVRVWRRQKLKQYLFIELRYLLMAKEGDFDVGVVFPRGDKERRYAKRYKNGAIKVGGYIQPDFDPTRKHNHRFAVLRQEELDYLYSKLSVLEEYIPLDGFYLLQEE